MKKDDFQTMLTEFFIMSITLEDKLDDMEEKWQVINFPWMKENSTLEYKMDLYNKQC